LLSDEPEKLERLSVLAEAIDVKSRTLLDWIERYPEDLPALRLPGSLRLRRKDLVAFLKKIQTGELK
jgi:hypothetical protein